MKWSAIHYDGFSGRQLRFDLNGVDGLVEVDAKWCDPTRRHARFVVQGLFEIDVTPLREALPDLRKMDEAYDCQLEDVGVSVLRADVDGEVIERKVRGGGLLVKDRPEIRPFMTIFKWIETLVQLHLPAEREA